MLSFLRATWILFLAHLRRTFFSKRAIVCLGLALVPVAAAFLITLVAREEGDSPPESATFIVGWMLGAQVIMPLIALILGSAAVAEEIEDRTITYLFTRPIPRAAILVSRWLAAVVLLVLLLVASMTVMQELFARIAVVERDDVPLPEGFHAHMLRVILCGGIVYSALFAASGTFLKRPVLVGLGYAFVIEGFLANIPTAARTITIQYYLKSLLVGDLPELAASFEAELLWSDLVTHAAAVRALWIIGGGALALGMWTLRRRQYLLSS